MPFGASCDFCGFLFLQSRAAELQRMLQEHYRERHGRILTPGQAAARVIYRRTRGRRKSAP